MMTQYLNRRLAANPPSGIRRIGQLAAGIPGCIALTIGEPDLDAPVSVRRKIAESILAGDTHYAPNAGYPELLSEISGAVNQRFGTDYAPDETVCTVGSTEAVAAALFAILNPGDEVIVPEPAFGLYKPLIEMAGGVYIPIDTTADGFQVRRALLESALTERTRAILFASPNNPNGVIQDAEALSVIREAALERDLFVLTDSVYDRLVYEDEFPSLMGDTALRDRLIYISAFSKTYAMTGVRVGYMLCEQSVMAQIRKAHAFLVTTLPSCIQKGVMGIFSVSPDDMVQIYCRRRDYVYRRLCEMGLETPLPGGAFYLFPSVEGFGMDADTFCDRLMHEGKLALIPSSCFGTSGHVRISYCYSDDRLKEGMDRLEAFVRSLRG